MSNDRNRDGDPEAAGSGSAEPGELRTPEDADVSAGTVEDRADPAPNAGADAGEREAAAPAAAVNEASGPAAGPSAAAGSAVTGAATAVPHTETGPAAAAPASRSSAAPIAWLALLLVLVVAAGGFYLMLDMQRREGLLLQRVQGLESVSGQDTTTFDQMRDNLQRQIELEVEGIKARQQRAEEDQQRAISRVETLASEAANRVGGDIARQISALQSALEEQQRRLSEQQQRVADQQQRINDLTVEDRESWQIAEVQYLLRLANQRLIMTGDTLSAEALLRSADNILRGLDDPDLMALRSAVASDLAAVRAVPRLDIEGLYLRLDALIRQTDALVMFRLPERSSEKTEVADGNWKDRLVAGYEVALQKLSEYIVISRRDVPVETLMDPQYEGLVRQNMRMLLEQAQVAMLSGNERLFRQSLERAEGWVSQFFKSDEQAAVAMAEELRLIRDERVAVTLPDLSASLQALDAAMKARLARSGS